MHTLQWIAVKVENELADPEQEAMQQVESYLDSQLNPGLSWFDWFVIGGGRWNPEQDPYASSSNMIISYEKNPDEYRAKIEWALAERKQAYAEYLRDVNYAGIQDKLDSYTGYMDYSFDLFPLKKAIEMLQGDWDYNSYYFDVEHDSANPKHMLDKLPSQGVEWYLVPVDFHF